MSGSCIEFTAKRSSGVPIVERSSLHTPIIHPVVATGTNQGKPISLVITSPSSQIEEYVDHTVTIYKTDSTRSVHLNPDDIFAWHTMGYTYSNLNKFEEALTVVNQALEINPNDYYAPKTRDSILSYLNKK